MQLKSISIFLVCAICIWGCKTTYNSSLTDGMKIFHVESADWTTSGEAKWEIVDNVIIGTQGLGYAVTTKEYDNFVMEAEFHPSKEVNSGIFLRCPEGIFTGGDCYEVNIWDDHTNQEYRTGAVVTHGKPLKHLNSVGKWNSYKIMAIDNHIQVWLNGVKTADFKNDKTSSGYIALQIFGEGEIKFRNVKISEVK